ncbi:MAG TPA: GAF domain-containing protein [Chloroflexaceae bacterium]|nr:GAF domain-containing protein [Chloroflexaceae bacterium]
MAARTHVLLVDADPDDRRQIGQALRRGLDEVVVRRVSTAEELAGAIAAGGFDLVVTGEQLGWARGLDVLRAVKARLPACPVVMLSSGRDVEQIVAAMQAGLDELVIEGPGRDAELAAVMRWAYQRARAQRQTSALAAGRDRLIGRLAQEREVLETLISQLPIGVIVAEAPSGRLLRSNAAAEQLWRSPLPPAAEIAEYSVYRGWRPGGRPYGPDEWPLARAVRDGETVRDEEIVLIRGDGELRTMLVSASPVRGGQGQVIAGVATFADVSERRHAEQVSRLLAGAARIVAASLDPEAALDALARLAVPALADSCVVDVIDADGTWRAVGVANVTPEHEGLIRELRRRYPPEAQPAHAGRKAAQARVSRLMPTVDDATLAAATADAEHLAMLRALGIASAMVVPLVSGERSLGVLALGVTGARRPYSPTDLALAEELAQLAALAIEHARLYAEGMAARATAQRRADRVSELQQLTAALSQALAPEDVAGVIISMAFAAVGAYAGSVALVAPEGEGLAVVGAQGYSAELIARWRHIPAEAPVPIAEAARGGAAIYLHDRAEWAARYPHLAAEQARSTSQAAAALPLRVEGRTLGALGLSFADPQAFAEEDRVFLETLANHCAQALDRARLFGLERDARAAAEANARALAQAEAALQARLAQQAAVSALGERALLVTDLQALLDAAVAAVARTLGVEHAGLLELLPDRATLRLRAGHGWSPGLVGEALISAGRGSQSGYTLAVDEPVIVEDLRAETRFAGSPLLHDHGVVSGASVIIRTPDGPFGVLGAFSVQRRRFTQDDIYFVQSVANVLGAAIDRLRAEAARHAFERQLQETQRLESLGVLAGGIAHDFNNLLAVIIGNAHLALAGLPPEATTRETIANIEQAAQRAAELTRQMLAYAGRGRFVVEPINLNELVEETHQLLQASISKLAVLRYQLTPGLPAIEADPTQIRQVLMNLVVNASEAIGERSGAITIGTWEIWADETYLAELEAPALEPGRYVTLEVSDTGVGMDAHTRRRIFEPFFTTKFTGRGLGLAAVQGIVHQHRGALKVYSEPGRGSTFKLLFPSLAAAAAPASARGNVPAGSWSGLVLVVEDEAEVRALLVRLLERMGFDALSAPDGRAGVELFRAYAARVRCVFLDMMMPHMSGEEAFRELKRIRPELPVVAMSGYTEEEVMGRFDGEGLAGFLAKPFTPETLRAQVEAALAGGEASA